MPDVAMLIVVAFELLALFSGSSSPGSLTRIEAVEALFEGLKPFPNLVSIGIVGATACISFVDSTTV